MRQAVAVAAAAGQAEIAIDADPNAPNFTVPDIVPPPALPADRLEACDRTTLLAMGAGIDALRDAGLPLVLRYKTTTTGARLPQRWMLPEALRDDTGVIFASAFPGYDSFAQDLERFANVCRVTNGLRNARIGAIGANGALSVADGNTDLDGLSRAIEAAFALSPITAST